MEKISIDKFVSVICQDLNIITPRIRRKKALQGTALAYYDYKDNVLYLKKSYDNDYDMYFSVAHELRHIYQIKYNVFDLSRHKSNLDISTRAYNLQEEEIDANAYALIIMSSAFHIKPLFNGLDDDIKAMIYKRANEIAKM